jgi:hypothetical protein
MLEELPALTGRTHKQAVEAANALGSEIEQLENQLTDLREPWGDLQADLRARRDAFQQAIKALTGGAAGRQKTEALAGVIDRIVCHFRHAGKKSYLESVEITPIAGECFTDGITPAQD